MRKRWDEAMSDELCAIWPSVAGVSSKLKVTLPNGRQEGTNS